LSGRWTRETPVQIVQAVQIDQSVTVELKVSIFKVQVFKA